MSVIMNMNAQYQHQVQQNAFNCDAISTPVFGRSYEADERIANFENINWGAGCAPMDNAS